jgi:hypothetical protein
MEATNYDVFIRNAKGNCKYLHFLKKITGFLNIPAYACRPVF